MRDRMLREIVRRMAGTGFVEEPVKTVPTPVKVGGEVRVKVADEKFTDSPRRRPCLTGLVGIARQVSARRRLLLAPSASWCGPTHPELGESRRTLPWLCR